MDKKAEYQFFPKNCKCPNKLLEVIEVFDKNINKISSFQFKLHSNEVLAILRKDLEDIDFNVEKGKDSKSKIKIPVLYGKNGHLEKTFDADAVNYDGKIVLEVEAGRAIANNQFLKDIFEACLMADIDYCVVAVRKIYNKSYDLNKVLTYMEALYSSNKFILPLKGILIIGY